MISAIQKITLDGDSKTLRSKTCQKVWRKAQQVHDYGSIVKLGLVEVWRKAQQVHDYGSIVKLGLVAGVVFVAQLRTLFSIKKTNSIL